MRLGLRSHPRTPGERDVTRRDWISGLVAVIAAAFGIKRPELPRRGQWVDLARTKWKYPQLRDGLVFSVTFYSRALSPEEMRLAASGLLSDCRVVYRSTTIPEPPENVT